MSDILLLETNLEGHLVPYDVRRTQVDLFQAFVRALSSGTRVVHERIETVGALRSVLERCADQNGWERARTSGSDRVEPTAIRFVHINAHGDSDGLFLRERDGGEAARTSVISAAFKPLRKANIKAIIMSACESGKNEAIAKDVLSHSGVDAVVGYPEAAWDNVSAMAEQMLYFQLLQHPSIRVWDAVRRVNDALVLLGEKSNKLLSCWVLNEAGEAVAYPWWSGAEDLDVKDKNSRSFLLQLRECFPERGEVGKEDLQVARAIVKRLL